MPLHRMSDDIYDSVYDEMFGSDSSDEALYDRIVRYGRGARVTSGPAPVKSVSTPYGRAVLYTEDTPEGPQTVAVVSCPSGCLPVREATPEGPRWFYPDRSVGALVAGMALDNVYAWYVFHPKYMPSVRTTKYGISVGSWRSRVVERPDSVLGHTPYLAWINDWSPWGACRVPVEMSGSMSPRPWYIEARIHADAKGQWPRMTPGGLVWPSGGRSVVVKPIGYSSSSGQFKLTIGLDSGASNDHTVSVVLPRTSKVSGMTWVFHEGNLPRSLGGPAGKASTRLVRSTYGGEEGDAAGIQVTVDGRKVGVDATWSKDVFGPCAVVHGNSGWTHMHGDGNTVRRAYHPDAQGSLPKIVIEDNQVRYLYPDGSYGVAIFSTNTFWPSALDRWQGSEVVEPRWVFLGQSTHPEVTSPDSIGIVGIDQKGWNDVHLFVFHPSMVPNGNRRFQNWPFQEAVEVKTKALRAGYGPLWYERT